MKGTWLILLLSVTGCVTPAPDGSSERVPEHGSAAGYECRAEPAQSLVGQPASATLGERGLQLSGARTLRWIRPGDAVTMDYRTDRLNISLDASNRVERISCG